MAKKKVNRNAKHLMYMSLFNTKEWHDLRERKIAECQGLCERCRREGIEKGILPDGYITPAKTVHHINPVEGVPDEPADTLLERMKERCFDYNNLILLCPDCHHRTHEEMKSHWRQASRTMPKDSADSEQQQEMKAFAERLGGKYEPTKRGIRKTRFGWVTKEEYKQKTSEQFEKWKQRINNGPKDTQGTPTVDSGAED